MTGVHTPDTAQHAARGEIFGHPAGLTVLFGTEMWERFSYYGMRALFVLYLTRYLLLPGHVEHVWGYATVKSFFEFFAGPLAIQPLSSLLYGSYTGLVYFTPLAGGWLADRVMGQRRVVVLGIVLMAFGHFMMAFESLLFPALFLLVMGVGIFKPNTTSQVGSLYAPGDHRRDRAYSIFYVGINLGAFLSPLICGSLGENVGWHYGFGAAGVGMLIALAVYLGGFASLPEDELTRHKAEHSAEAPLSGDEKHAVLWLVLLILPLTLYWACYEQQGNTIALWAADNTDRNINLLFWRGDIDVTWFQSVNPLMIFVFTPFVVALWRRQAAMGKEPSTARKMIFGCGCMAAANAMMALAALLTGPADKASWLWLFWYFTVLTVGELYLSPVSLSLYSKASPPKLVSTMMAVGFIPNFLGGGFLQGWLGAYWSTMGKPEFFLMIAAIAAMAGAGVLGFSRPLRRLAQE
jgi:POT family proton-dependent oligopeptide transporter